MRMNTALGLAVAAVLTMTAAASAEVTLQDRQNAACYDDVQKLCGAFIPDAQKVEACMIKVKSKVSARCRKYYK